MYNKYKYKANEIFSLLFNIFFNNLIYIIIIYIKRESLVGIFFKNYIYMIKKISILYYIYF